MENANPSTPIIIAAPQVAQEAAPAPVSEPEPVQAAVVPANLKTIEVEGVRFSIDPELASDWDVMLPLARVMEQQKLLEDSDSDSNTQIFASMAVAVDDVAKALFGSNLPRIKQALRDQHGGRLPIETMAQFVVKTIEESAKN